jgi:hypothetical protein
MVAYEIASDRWCIDDSGLTGSTEFKDLVDLKEIRLGYLQFARIFILSLTLPVRFLSIKLPISSPTVALLWIHRLPASTGILCYRRDKEGGIFLRTHATTNSVNGAPITVYTTLCSNHVRRC